LGVLEEKRDDDSESESIHTDEEGNVFDKLLRRTVDPGRSELIQPYNESDSDDSESESEESGSEEEDSESEGTNGSEDENDQDIDDTNSTPSLQNAERGTNSRTLQSTLQTSKARDTG
jgi:hypothetical protein